MVGHAVSWQNSKDLHFSSNKIFKSKLWTPNNFQIVKSDSGVETSIQKPTTSSNSVKLKSIDNGSKANTNNKLIRNSNADEANNEDSDEDVDFSDEEENYDEDDEFNMIEYSDSNDHYSEENESNNLYFKNKKNKNLNDISNFLNLKSTCLTSDDALQQQQQQHHHLSQQQQIDQAEHHNNHFGAQEHHQHEENKILGSNRNCYAITSNDDNTTYASTLNATSLQSYSTYAYDVDLNYDPNNSSIKLLSNDQHFVYNSPQQQQQQQFQAHQQQYGYNIANQLCNYTNLNCSELIYANFNELTPPSSTSSASSTSAFNYYNNEAKLLKSNQTDSSYSYLSLNSLDSASLATFCVQTNDFNVNNTNSHHPHSNHHIQSGTGSSNSRHHMIYDNQSQLLIDPNINYYYSNN